MSDLVQRFMGLYRDLPEVGAERFATVYRSDVLFVDPFHRLQGLPALQRYLATVYAGTRDAGFDCEDPLVSGSAAVVVWSLSFRHPRLAGGREIEVPGISHLRFDDLIFEHRDYYDAGALLYEHVPLLGPFVRYLKRRLRAD